MATYSTVAAAVGSPLDMISLGSGKFVCVGAAGYVITSGDNGATWTSRTASEANDWTGLAYDGTTVVAVAWNGIHRVMTSTDDGHTWTNRTAAAVKQWTSVTWSPAASLFIAVELSAGITNQVMTSPDGITWTSRNGSSGQVWTGVASSGSLILAVEPGSCRVMKSSDGINWSNSGIVVPTNMSIPQSGGSNTIVYSSTLGKFVIAGEDSVTAKTKIAYTTDGSSWSYSSGSPLDGYFTAQGLVAANSAGGLITTAPFTAASSATDAVLSSTDAGATWVDEHTGLSTTLQWYPLAWDDASGTLIGADIGGSGTMLLGVFASASITPDHGYITGGELFTIDDPAAGMVSGCTVTFVRYFGDSHDATNVTFVSASQITGLTPPYPRAEIVSVFVTNPDSSVPVTLQDAFTYLEPSDSGGPGSFTLTPTHGPMAGGTVVTITGNDLLFPASPRVFFGDAQATGVSGGGTGTLTCITSAHAPETVDVTIYDS